MTIRTHMNRFLILATALSLLGGCDRLYERVGLPDPAKALAEGKAIGGACRHAGRGLEDCYTLNPTASKAAIYEGWKEMHEYMAKHGIQAVPPQIAPLARVKSGGKAEETEDEADTEAGGKEAKAAPDMDAEAPTADHAASASERKR